RTEVGGLDGVGPGFERGGSLGSGLGHGVHHPSKNFGRAGMAWITAVPSSSLTTPTSGGPAFLAGPMYIVAPGSSVSKAGQWLRSAWSMSSSLAPCLRARASMSGTAERYRPQPDSSIYVDESGSPGC